MGKTKRSSWRWYIIITSCTIVAKVAMRRCQWGGPNPVVARRICSLLLITREFPNITLPRWFNLREWPLLMRLMMTALRAVVIVVLVLVVVVVAIVMSILLIILIMLLLLIHGFMRHYAPSRCCHFLQHLSGERRFFFPKTFICFRTVWSYPYGYIIRVAHCLTCSPSMCMP